MGQPNSEPSMEDILASIKRIIAEDSEAVGARAPKLRRDAMAAVTASPLVAVPPEPQADEPAKDEITPAEQAVDETATAADDDTADILELTSPMPETSETSPAPATAIDGLLSTSSAEASRTAFAALTQLQVRSDEGQPNTLEGLVSDLLRPMLREWLDRELPALVERLVSAEVARLSGRS